MKILIDTNMFLAVKSLDVFSALRKHGTLATVSPCVKELERIAKSRKRSASAAKIALSLLKKNRVRVIKARKPADPALVSYGKKGFAVATNDRKLIKALKNNGIKVIRLRQKKLVVVM